MIVFVVVVHIVRYPLTSLQVNRFLRRNLLFAFLFCCCWFIAARYFGKTVRDTTTQLFKTKYEKRTKKKEKIHNVSNHSRTVQFFASCTRRPLRTRVIAIRAFHDIFPFIFLCSHANWKARVQSNESRTRLVSRILLSFVLALRFPLTAWNAQLLPRFLSFLLCFYFP